MNIKKALLAICLIGILLFKWTVQAIKFVIENGERILIYIIIYLLVYSSYLYLIADRGNMISFVGEDNNIYLAVCSNYTQNINCKKSLL